MINVDKQGAMLRVTLNRPQKANSLTRVMLQELVTIVHDARQNSRVMVITGAGNVFSAGADLDEVRAGLATSELWETLSRGIADLPCLTIAALNGTLAGGAFGMALACDLRVAVTGAKFFYPVMKLGFLPQPSDPVRMAALIGPARSKMILMAGQKIPAEQALNWGLIDRLTEPENLDETVSELAEDALGASTEHIAAIKGLVP